MYVHRYYLYEHYYTGIKRRLPEVIRLTDLLNSESMERNCILRIHLTTKVTRILRQRLKTPLFDAHHCNMLLMNIEWGGFLLRKLRCNLSCLFSPGNFIHRNISIKPVKMRIAASFPLFFSLIFIPSVNWYAANSPLHTSGFFLSILCIYISEKEI